MSDRVSGRISGRDHILILLLQWCNRTKKVVIVGSEDIRIWITGSIYQRAAKFMQPGQSFYRAGGCRDEVRVLYVGGGLCPAVTCRFTRPVSLKSSYVILLFGHQ